MEKSPRAKGPLIVVIGVVLVFATVVVAVYLWQHEEPNRRRTMELMKREADAGADGAR